MATTVTLKPNAIDLSGSTSGTTTLQATAVAGTTTITLPAATDTLVGKATTDTLTNKTLTAPTLASANITTALTLTGASGTNGQVLTSAGTGAAPTWSSPSTTSISNGTSNVTVNSSGGTITATTAGTTAVTIDTSQNVGIGTTSPQAKLHVLDSVGGTNGTLWLGNATYYGTIQHDAAVSGSNIYTVATASAGGHIFKRGSTEQMRIPSGGGIRIAMQNYASDPSSTNYGVSINNTSAGSRFFGQGSGTETQIEFGNTNGTRGSIQTNSTNTLYNTTSDYRLKENVLPMANALATVLALKPCTYKWKVDGSNGQGFIAHELQAVVPDCVSGEKDAVDENGDIKPQFVDTSFLVATLTAALQELSAKNDALTARIVALEAK